VSAPAVTLAQSWVRSERIVARRIGDDVVLVPLAGRGADIDSIYSLNRVAAFVWEALAPGKSGDAVVDALVARFEVDRERAAADYLELVDTLRDVGAVVLRE
jgi:hypothetical protein